MTRFECTIHEAITTVDLVVLKNRPATSKETLKKEARLFVRKYRARIPNFIKELLMKKQFSFCPNAIMGRAYTAGGEYRLHYEYSYPEMRCVTFQAFLKRVTKWRVLNTEIDVGYNPATKKTTLKVTMEVIQPVGVIPQSANEVK